jgi:hypothetical protein
MARAFGPGVFASITTLVVSGHRFLMTLLAMVVALIVYAGILTLIGWLLVRNSRVESAPHELTIRNLFGLSHSVAAHHLGSAILVNGIEPVKRGNLRNLGPRLYVLDTNGRAVLRWTESRWDGSQMRQLAESLELPTESISRISLKDLGARYPHALRFNEAHQTTTVLIILGVLAALVTGVGLYASTLPN